MIETNVSNPLCESGSPPMAIVEAEPSAEGKYEDVIRRFAEKHRLRVRRDSCGHLIIPGKKTATDMPDRMEYRNHIYDGFGGGKLDVCLMFLTPARWTWARKRMDAAGFRIRQNGDTEGCTTFDPENEQQVRLAMKLAGIRTVNLTPEERQRRVERGRRLGLRKSSASMLASVAQE